MILIYAGTYQQAIQEAQKYGLLLASNWRYIRDPDDLRMHNEFDLWLVGTWYERKDVIEIRNIAIQRALGSDKITLPEEWRL